MSEMVQPPAPADGGDGAVAEGLADTLATVRAKAPRCGEEAFPGATTFLDRIGLVSCPPSDLTEPVTGALARALAVGAIGWATLVECLQSDAVEAVVFDLGVGVPQRRVHDIRPVERIAVTVMRGAPDEAPEALVLRADFPRGPLHLNLRPHDWPPSLCLYDVPFRDVRMTWTPSHYVGLIQHWLAATARDALHRGEQPLEFMLPQTANRIILPRQLRDAALASTDQTMTRLNVALRVEYVELEERRHLLRVAPDDAAAQRRGVRSFITVVRTPPRLHGPMRRLPSTLADVAQMFDDQGNDLLGAMRDAMEEWRSRGEVAPAAPCVLIVLVPLQRAAGEPPERIETLAFLLARLGDVGVDVGAWGVQDGFVVPIIGDAKGRGERTAVALLNPTFTVNRDDLAALNGYGEANSARIVAIGAGALGSQVITNAARAGIGVWTTVDDDLVLPHNSARHIADRAAWGLAKAEVVTERIRGLADDDCVHTGFVADGLKPGEQAAAFRAAVAEADILVDLAASVTVARAVARDFESSARRVSLYLSPTGLDLTVLAEGSGRAVPLDALEMQLYRAMRHEGRLIGLLAETTDRVRYGRTCRDVSAEIPQWAIAIHAGIGARVLTEVMNSDQPFIGVWRIDPATMGVYPTHVGVHATTETTVGGWRIVVDNLVLSQLALYRAKKLPRETGGVLLGHHDMQRHIVYIVDVVPSPQDSREYPHAYYRGCDGLPELVAEAQARTGGQLAYIGEWHSHPRGYSCRPSSDDCRQFEWLNRALAPEGLPPVLVIVGDAVAVPWVGQIAVGAEYPATWTLE